MVLKRTENIWICIVIVYSVKLLEFTVMKYFQKFITKVQKLEDLFKLYACL